MKRVRYRRLGILLLVFTTATLLLACSQKSTTLSVFQMRSGVVVDLDRRLVHLMSAEHGIDAVELIGGTRVWSTNQAAKPLALVGALLICQVEPSDAGNEVGIVVLDTLQRGQRVAAGLIKLPAGVGVSIDETLNSSFAASARVLAGDVFVSWQHSTRFIEGAPHENPALPGQGAPSEGAAAETRVTSGTYRMDLASGVMFSMQPDELPAAPTPPAADLPVAERLTGVSGVQYLSADGGYVLSSQRIADDSAWEKYRWTIYDRSTGKRIGEFKSHLSRSSFFVMDSKVFYETGPYLRQTNNRLVEEPLKIRAVDLRTGQELWSWQVRDTAYRGPYPP